MRELEIPRDKKRKLYKELQTIKNVKETYIIQMFYKKGGQANFKEESDGGCKDDKAKNQLFFGVGRVHRKNLDISFKISET